jgi:hypothetical protein
MRKGVPSNQMKALAMAMGGAVVAAVATMFVPAAMLESFTGATGLSELIPSAAAPLGDTARAIIAFGAGAFTLAVLAYLLLRQDAAPKTTENAEEAVSFKERLARIALPKMPWTKGKDDITDLSDLPKLRNGDVHPDAPPRRPLWAGQDLPVLDLAEIAVIAPEADDEMAVEADEVSTSANPMPELAEEIALAIAPPIMPVAQIDAEPTLAEMVAQLEAAVAERQNQLAELEAVAAQLGAGPVMAENVSAEPAQAFAPVPEPVRAERPPLEAVPVSAKDDNMDSALAAALATLHRMNGTDR